jgi:glutamate racemase
MHKAPGFNMVLFQIHCAPLSAQTSTFLALEDNRMNEGYLVYGCTHYECYEVLFPKAYNAWH